MPDCSYIISSRASLLPSLAAYVIQVLLEVAVYYSIPGLVVIKNINSIIQTFVAQVFG